MKNAPSVEYPVGRFVWEWRAGWLAVVVLSALAVLWGTETWWRWRIHEPLAGDSALRALAWTACSAFWCAVVLRRERSVAQGALLWTERDGAALWEWSAPERMVQVEPVVRLDMGMALWLELRTPDGRCHWVWAFARQDASQWRPFRRALRRGIEGHRV